MKRFAYFSRSILLALLAAAWAGSSVFAQGDFSEMKGFKIPEYDENGVKTSELTGDLARMNRKGEIVITNLRIDFFKEGEIESSVRSPTCVYNQQEETARSDDEVFLQRDNLTVTGKGFTYDRAKEVFKIFSEAKVVVKNLDNQVDLGEEP